MAEEITLDIEQGFVPPEHQAVIDHILAKNELPPGTDVLSEGGYLTVKETAYCPDFITCVAVVLETGGEKKCLHASFGELTQAPAKGKFNKADFATVLNDLKSADSVTMLISSEGSKHESRESEAGQAEAALSSLIVKSGGKREALKVNRVPGNQFQLVITPDATSVWNGTKFIGVA